MIRAIIFFVVFTIAATAPVKNNDHNKLNDALETKIEKLLLNEKSEENEIPKEKPLKNKYDNFEDIKGNDDEVNKILVESIVNDSNYSEKEWPIKQSQLYLNYPYEDVKANLIEIDHRNKPELKLSAFVTILVEFMKSIAEEIISIYKR